MKLLDFFQSAENKSLKEEVQKLKELLNPEQTKLINLENEIKISENKKEELQKSCDEYNNKILECKNKITELEQTINSKQKQIIQLDDEILYQSFSIYKPLYDFANSEQYKDKLEDIREKQKRMVKNKTAVSFFDGWTVDGSKAKGRKMTNDNIKQILRSFNVECDNIIDKVKFNNIDSMKTRIEKSFELLNSLNSTNRISITSAYKSLKIDELNLAYEYQKKKQEEKEEQKRIREELREQEKVQKELAEARKNINKDKEHYEKALKDIAEKIENETDASKLEDLKSKKVEIEQHLEEINTKLKDIDYREANQKAGYVYVISNIGSFGPDIYKIGMTRRLEPEERIRELSDASVPFNFDIHALIFTEDAPALESALHRAFENQKVNMVNHRREFFHVSLDEIKKVINENFDKTVDFILTPPAEQYRESKKILETLSNSSNDS